MDNLLTAVFEAHHAENNRMRPGKRADLLHALEDGRFDLAGTIPLQAPILTKPRRFLDCRRPPCWDWHGGGGAFGDFNREKTQAHRPSPSGAGRPGAAA
jgi:hypothetical protein